MINRQEYIIQLLKEGHDQTEIAKQFKKHPDFKIAGKSTIEKEIQAIKKKYGVKTMFQLGLVIGKEEK